MVSIRRSYLIVALLLARRSGRAACARACRRCLRLLPVARNLFGINLREASAAHLLPAQACSITSREKRRAYQWRRGELRGN